MVMRNRVSPRSATRRGSRVTRSSHTHTSPIFEPLEGRTMYSASPAVAAVPAPGSTQTLLTQATTLNDVGFRRRDIVVGDVGQSQSHAVYAFDVTTPVTLRVVLARLRQNDQ